MRLSSEKMSQVAYCIATVAVFCCASTRAENLTAEIKIQKPLIKQGSSFKAQLIVKNESSTTQIGVYPSGLILQYSGTGSVTQTTNPSPALTSLEPGASVAISFTFRAELPGTINLYGRGKSSTDLSTLVSSSAIVIVPKKIGGTAETDAEGQAQIKVGKAIIPISMIDQDSQTPISGLVVSGMISKSDQGRAVIAIIDPQKRYPMQIRVVTGPRGGASSVKRLRTKWRQGGPVTIAAGGACGPGEMYKTIIVPVESHLLPAPKPTAEPPSPKVADDSDTAWAAIQAALKSPTMQLFIKNAKDTFVMKENVITCAEALNEDRKLINDFPTNQGEVMDTIAGKLMYPAQEVLMNSGKLIRGGMIVGGNVSQLMSAYNLYTDVMHCGLLHSDETMLVREITFAPFLPMSPFVLHKPFSLEPDETNDSQFPKAPFFFDGKDEFGNPLTTGSLELFSRTNAGIGFQAALENGAAGMPVPIGDFDYCLRSPGFDPAHGQVMIANPGTSLTATLMRKMATRATLTAPQPTGFLAEGTTFQVTPHFFDKDGNEVVCSGHIHWQVYNPVGTTVANVDGNGVVTMAGGCGAARLTAWCDGITSRPMLLSTNCDGKLPPQPKTTFVVNPVSISFTAEEGGGNPPAQYVYLLNLAYRALNYNMNWTGNWLSIQPSVGQGNPYVVNIAGLRAGTYSTTVLYTDADEPNNKASVKVTLTIKAAPIPEIAGTYSGTWTKPVFGFGDDVMTLTLNLVQKGKNVTGTYTRVIIDGVTDPPGTTYAGNLVQGVMTGKSLTIFTEGGTQLTGTFSGNMFNGQGGSASGVGPFSLTKQ